MIKRTIDIVLSFISILFLTPLLLPIIIILRFTGEGYIFYRQERIGRFGKPFNLLKFATMYKDSPNMEGGNITAKNDQRILPFGSILRKYKVNELPQIINVLLGDMSIIGRRPVVKEHYDFYDHITKENISHFKPGLSGVSSVVFRNEEIFFSGMNSEKNKEFYREQMAPFKGKLETWYANNQSLFVDILFMIITVFSIIYPPSNLHNLFFPDLPKHSVFNKD